jgi:glycyl-tRNA synthetase beta subunit
MITNGLVDAGLTYEGAAVHATPRRLVLSVEGLYAKAADMLEERKGPRTDAPKPAIAGFLKSTGLKLEELKVQDDKKGKFYIASIKKPGRAATDVVAELVPETIRKFPWPKSMRWGAGQVRWVRQLLSIMPSMAKSCLSKSSIPPATPPWAIAFSAAKIESAALKITHRNPQGPRHRRCKHRAETIHRSQNLAFAQGLE